MHKVALLIVCFLFSPTASAQLICSSFQGATAGDQIAAAIGTLPSGGGTIDCRSYGASTQVIKSLLLGSASKPVTMIVDNATKYNVGDVTTCSSGVDLIRVFNGSAIVSLGLGQALGGSGARFQLNCPASSTIESMISNGQHDDTQEFFKLEGLVLQGQSGVTPTKGLLFLKNIFVNSVVRDVYTANCYATCLFLDGVGGNLSDVVFDNDNFDSTGTTTCPPGITVCPVVYISGDSTGAVANINFVGGAIQHAGPGQSLLYINGNATAVGAYGLFFRGVHFETSASPGDAIQLWDANHVVIEPGVVSGPAGVNFIKIAEDGTGTTHDIEVQHLLTLSSWTHTINDTINGKTYSNQNILHYVFPQSTIIQ